MKLSSAQRNALMVFAYYAPNGHLPTEGKIKDLHRWGIRINTMKWLCRNGLILLSAGPSGRFVGYALRLDDIYAMRRILAADV